MKPGLSLCATGALLLSLMTMTSLAHAEDGPPGYGFAQRCDEPGVKLTTLETVACGSTKLREQEQTMLDLVQSVSEETSGVDGDTGVRSNPIGKEQNQWRNALARKCSAAACLSAAYTARIEQIQKKWADALQ